MVKGLIGTSDTGSSFVRRPSPALGDEVYNAIYAQLMSLKIRRAAVSRSIASCASSASPRTPIREALSRLEALGLVVKTHLIGCSAAPQLDKDRLQQLYELRLLLEPFAAGRAAVNHDGRGYRGAGEGRQGHALLGPQ